MFFRRNRKRFLINIIPFLPLLILNLWATAPTMKNLVHHYSLLIVPILAIEVQDSLINSNDGLFSYPYWMQRKAPKIILLWTILIFIIFSRLTFFIGPFQARLDTAKERREAINLVYPDAAVLTTNDIVPHLSRRKIILSTGQHVKNLNIFDQVLIDLKHPGWNSSRSLMKNISEKLSADELWIKRYDKGSILLFQKRSG